MTQRDWIRIDQPVTPRQRTTAIIAEVAEAHGFTVADLLGPGRKRVLSYARFAAIRRIRAETNLSTMQIGRLFNRDHTTICHALHHASDLCESVTLTNG